MRSSSCLRFLCLTCAFVEPVAADVVIDWNQQVLQAIRVSSTPPPVASRAMAMVHTAVFDAVNSIDDTYQPYHINLSVPSTASREAAAAQAAHDVLANLYPAQTATFDARLAIDLAAIADASARIAGVSTGSTVAAAILALRANDHSSDVVAYTASGLPGRWKPTPPAYAAPVLPNWPTVNPWAMSSGSQYRGSPPSLTDAEYAADFEEVRALGSATSVTRTPEQTDIARFWADGAGSATPPGHWNLIAQDVAEVQGNTVSENARLFALLNIATADAAIACWDNKYAYDFWRPITAIREADSDGNPKTSQDLTWTPLLTTPSFPTYTSGHSTFSSAAATILAAFFGTDDIAFTSSSEVPGVADRSFLSFSEAAQEAGRSRIYGGIHFQFDNQDALAIGDALGHFVYRTQLLAVPEPTGSLLLLIGMLGLTAARRCQRRAALAA